MTPKLKSFLIWFVLIVVLLALLQLGKRDSGASPNAILDTEQAVEMIESGAIATWSTTDKGQLRLHDFDGNIFACQNGFDPAVRKSLDENSVFLNLYDGDRSSFWTLLPTILIIIAVLLALFWFLRRRAGGGQGGLNNVFELRKTKARAIDESNRVRFDQIGGNHDARETLTDIVDFLKDPARWQDAGARIPRGILLAGPPGTGKTLLARAVAGETNASFFYTSATEFVEMFVGVGAARVRDTFETASKAQPAVVFIDELDAIGRKRGSGMGTMHEEREQTLNQLLVLMDGLERFTRLVVMAATNRPDVLDPALMRSGRFDRIVRFTLPSLSDRVEILKIHMQQKPMAPAATPESLAPHTSGLTGADIETALNEAALFAVRRNRRENDGAPVSITEQDVCHAIENMKKGNRQFNTLDAVLVESVTQLAEPTGRAVARITTVSGSVIEGDVVWMNSIFIKLRTAEGEEVVVARELAERIDALEGTGMAAKGDVAPDRWNRPNLDTL